MYIRTDYDYAPKIETDDNDNPTKGNVFSWGKKKLLHIIQKKEKTLTDVAFRKNFLTMSTYPDHNSTWR